MLPPKRLVAHPAVGLLGEGEACARTTWENATLTSTCLQQHHPNAPVPLITAPWQLPRPSRAFASQDLQVQPLAWRETAATLLYWFQGRM